MKKNILFIFIGFVIGVSCAIFIGFMFMPKCQECNKCEDNNTDQTINENNESIDLSTDEKEKYDSLVLIATELYNNSVYLSYLKQPNGLYVITYSDIKELGYDTSKYGNCSGDIIAIYFDPDNVLSNEYAGVPANVNLNCSVGN